MNKSQLKNFCKKSRFILFLILLVFFLKGVLLATLHPIFDGQDEARHYNTVQYLAEPKEKNWDISTDLPEHNRNNFETYRFSEEIKKTATLANNDVLRTDIFNTIIFSDDYNGINETEINQKNLQPINKTYPPDVVSGAIFYHKVATVIEKIFTNQSILVRFYLIRILSVLFGTMAVLFSYWIIKNIGFSEKHSLLLTVIIAFQPKFSDYLSNINYDALTILMFFLFTLGGVLMLKKGLNWKNFILMLFSSFIAFKTKGTGVVLFGMLALMLLYFFHQKIENKQNYLKKSFYIIFTAILVILFLYFKRFLPLGNRSILQIILSLFEYLGATLTVGKFMASANTYWGALSWVNNPILDKAIYIIWFIQAFAIAGLGLFFFSKQAKPKYLPEKKYIIFLLVITLALQIGVRAYDWKIFSSCNCFALGLPGRYFLPNLTSHIILVFVGLGTIFSYFKKENYFNNALKIGIIAMSSLSLYLIFNLIIYRFYL